MATTAGPRKTISIYDYPEHLNPFREEDNHNKIRFWTIGRKLSRSNSISFPGIKELKNSWSLRSFMKKGKRGQQETQEKSKPTTPQTNGESSVVEYRNALQCTDSTTSMASSRNTVSSPERADRYVYGGSITPLPRSRFQERLRSPSNYEVNSLSATPRMTRSEVSGSRQSVGSTNPFDEDESMPPVRAPRRKKKRAAPLPPVNSIPDNISIDTETKLRNNSLSDTNTSELNDTHTSILNDTHNSSFNDKQAVSLNDTKSTNIDEDIDELNCNIELKIVEDVDISNVKETKTSSTSQETEQIVENSTLEKEEKINETTATQITVKNAGSDDDILQKVSFPKVDITKYRRNSSVNDDDIRLRRGNLEDFHAISKRSKSLTSAFDGSYVGYDINLNEDKNIDANGNEEPQKVVCKLYEDSRKQSIETLSSTEKEFIEIDKATRELEREISKLNSALTEDDLSFTVPQKSVSDIKRMFDKNDISSPNPIPKPRRSHHGDVINLV